MKFYFAAINLPLPLLIMVMLLATMAVIVVLLVLTVTIITLWQRSALVAKASGGARYQAVPLLSPAEQSFFRVLQQVIAQAYSIFPKVRLADIISPGKSSSRSGWRFAFNRIASKHVDFVLCDPQSLRVVGVIELDDSTHRRFERGIRDWVVDSALGDAAIPVFRFPAARSYSLVQIRQQLESLRSPAQASQQRDLIKA
ncbi:MAG TPA: DUF2726 domain-containing protein [Verrucomicrobiae bacterium]|jgi:hypothetical protein|nr:DUF2726 domain-containing protein [Verrucomicrobiae bacterium]